MFIHRQTFYKLRATALKNLVSRVAPLKILLRGCHPLTPPTFLKKSGQKTFNCHRRHLVKNPNEVSLESFCRTFFKKFVGLRGNAPHRIVKGEALNQKTVCHVCTMTDRCVNLLRKLPVNLVLHGNVSSWDKYSGKE